MEQNKQLTAVIHGKVQGVGFRYFVQTQANWLQLTGWTGNRKDGTVEVVAQGSTSKLDELLRMLHQGPTSSQVTKIDHQISDSDEEFQEFKIKRFFR